ncbi:MAG: anti-sigma factor [Arthrobacter sp.]
MRQWRERQYLERLRTAWVPAASDDLTARLLSRTQHLATAVTPAPAADPTPHIPAMSGATKALSIVAGGAMAAVGLVAVAAYVLAGDPTPVAGEGIAGGVIPQSVQRPADSQAFEAAGSAEAAGTLNAEQLAVLRTEGWVCPELQDLGFHLLWARHETVAGHGVLEMNFTDGRHFATVLEQHPQSGQPVGAPVASLASSPMNVMTGHPAADDGFVPAPDHGAPRDGALWVHSATPWRAIYQASGITFTYVSDLPAEKADDGMAELMRDGAASNGAPSSDPGASQGGPAVAGTGITPAAQEPLTARLQRGLSRIIGLFSP